MSERQSLERKIAVAVLTVMVMYLFGFTPNIAAQPKEIKCALNIEDRAIDVKLNFPANSLSETRLSLTDWGGQKNYAENIYRLSFTDGSGAILPFEKIGEREWKVENNHRAFALAYTVVSQKESFMGSNRRNHFHPTIFKNYVFAWASSFLIFPEAADIAASPVALRMSGNEYGKVYSNFRGKADSYDDLHELFVAAGDYRMIEKRAGGRTIRFLLQGKNWKFSDADFVGTVMRIIEAQTKYMRFYPTDDDLLITLNEGAANNRGGTVVRNVISVYPDPQTGLQDFETLKLIAHEHFHFWNGNFLRPAEDKPEGYYKWLNEGFTEYYAGLTLYRENLITAKEFTEWINNLLLEYQTNSLSLTATADELSKNYWQSNDYNRLPYVKGALLALLFNVKIRQATAGENQIDDFVRQLMRETEPKKGFDDRRISAIFSDLIKTDGRQFYADFVLGAKPLPIKEIFKNSAINVSLKPREVFELGFVTESGRLERGAKIERVSASAAAEKAGIKAGDEIKAMNFVYGNPLAEATITVIRKNQPQQIKSFRKKPSNCFR